MTRRSRRWSVFHARRDDQLEAVQLGPRVSHLVVHQAAILAPFRLVSVCWRRDGEKDGAAGVQAGGPCLRAKTHDLGRGWRRHRGCGRGTSGGDSAQPHLELFDIGDPSHGFFDGHEPPLTEPEN